MQWQSSHSMVGTKTEEQKKLQSYWSFRDEKSVIDGIAKRGRRIIMHTSLQGKALKQLHINHMGIKIKNAGMWVSKLDQYECLHRRGNQNNVKTNTVTNTRKAVGICQCWHLYNWWQTLSLYWRLPQQISPITKQVRELSANDLI